jgi:ABC-2 type transport system permease protein
MKVLGQIYEVMMRELQILRQNHIYRFCMVLFPILVIIFFTTLLDDGLPTSMPVGIVDLDNTSTTRALERKLDGFQMSKVVAHYPSVAEARQAIQRNEIYGFLYIPKGTTSKLLASRQPKISYYYTYTTMVAGSMIMKDMKTISSLGSAALGQATMRAKGLTDKQIQTLLQPITIDLHQIANPWSSYNVYLTTVMVPGILMIFIFLISAYSLGTELKFASSKNWLAMADNNVTIALVGKFLPQTLIWLAIVFGYQLYVFFHLGFPHQGSPWMLVLLGLMHVMAAQGFGIFAFGLMPSLRMSMSVCSLWAVLSISMAGSAFPAMGMDAALQSLAWLFPLRHYFMLYQACIFNGFPLHMAWFHFMALGIFIVLPLFTMRKLRKAMLEYVYIP